LRELYTATVPILHIVYASTSGHTAYVLETLTDFLKQEMRELVIKKQRAEQTKPEDLLDGDVLLLASSTWNTGGIEGQLNPHMHALLKERAKSQNLKGMKCALVGLGDDRYHYTVKALQHLHDFVETHKGTLLLPGLRIVNEPYGQEERVRAWGKELLVAIKDLDTSRLSPES
jgi:flavodoxin